MADGSVTVTITIPANPVASALDVQTVARSVARGMLQQAAHDVGDVSRNSGNLTYSFNFSSGNQVFGTWTFTPPA
jgi:hypothetical protein